MLGVAVSARKRALQRSPAALRIHLAQAPSLLYGILRRRVTRVEILKC